MALVILRAAILCMMKPEVIRAIMLEDSPHFRAFMIAVTALGQASLRIVATTCLLWRAVCGFALTLTYTATEKMWQRSLDLGHWSKPTRVFVSIF